MSSPSKSQLFVKALESKGLNRKLVTDYASLLSGQIGRVIFSVIYFITLAKTLSLGDFGLFATASSIGIVLSRVSGFGFISPLYRVATTRPRLIGAYTAGYMTAVLISLPLVIALTLGIHALIYSQLMSLSTFAWIIAAEVIFWRSLEAVIIVLNGRQRFATASVLAISGVAAKSLAAVGFALYGMSDLQNWAVIYCAANAIMALIAIILFYPRQKLRWAPKAWLGRSKDALGVSAAEILFYTQSELDKVLVLAFGGEIIAGIYAIVMRLIDLTAMPLRALNTMLIQWIMRQRQSRKSNKFGLKMDAGIGGFSVLALLGITALLYFAPPFVGENIKLGGSFLLLLLLVPAFRNIIEYHTELLYAHEKMKPRVLLLAALTIAKALLLILLLSKTAEFSEIALWLNGVFAVLYIISAFVTYRVVLNAKSKPAVFSNPSR